MDINDRNWLDYGPEKSIDLPLTSQGPGKSVVSSV